jgi:hypothetical protein
MDLIPIYANPERDWCKRTKPNRVLDSFYAYVAYSFYGLCSIYYGLI